MATTLTSEEVAEDYKQSLEDLTLNSRYEISNLTVIAKESMDHALAISRVLETHIKTVRRSLSIDNQLRKSYVSGGWSPPLLLHFGFNIGNTPLTSRQAPPNRKLPALYVLDSIVKNVGTPYTLFFGRNLYQTYMNAYTLVDTPVRKKLEEMLKTWKEPVPGSMDSRPVFPVDVTRPIENALIKARTAAVQLQQQQSRTQTGRISVPPRATPTPPGGPPFPPGYPLRHGTNGSSLAAHHLQVRRRGYIPASVEPDQHFKSQPARQSTPAQPIAVPYPEYDARNTVQTSLDALNHDISNLIAGARTEFAAHPYDHGVQQRLKALLDLQSILQSQTLPPDQLDLIKDQVAQLSRATRPPKSPVPAPSPAIIPPPQGPVPLAQPPPSLHSLVPPDALAALLASVTPAQRPTPPPPPPALPVSQPPSLFNLLPAAAAPSLTHAPLSVPGESPLLASLRAAGMLPPLPPAVTVTATPPLPASFPAHLPPPPPPPVNNPFVNGHHNLALASLSNDLELTSASLKR
jgi:pre-mRNA cleavage complex 2 protein Pcf11